MDKSEMEPESVMEIIISTRDLGDDLSLWKYQGLPTH